MEHTSSSPVDDKSRSEGHDNAVESDYNDDVDRLIGGLDNLSVHETVFKHTTLPDPARYIRLLRFLPGIKGSHLEFKLTTWKHEESPDYTAISYVWGNPDPSHYIVAEGSPFAVTSNCHYALWQVSLDQTNYSTTERHYWIDSVCISQSDLPEKGAQVQKMGDIFASAQEVLSCVGPHAQSSELFWEVMKVDSVDRTLHNWLDQAKSGCSEDEHRRWRTKTLSNLMVGTRRLWMKQNRPGDLPGFHKRFTDAFEAFSDRTYWRRLWIVQEVQAARNVRVLCGCSVINLASIAAYLSCWSHDPAGAWQTHLENSSPMAVALYMSGLVPHAEGVPYGSGLVDMLAPGKIFSVFEQFECTNFRDRLYALLRLISWARNEWEIIPDYSITKFGLMMQLARTLAHWHSTKDNWSHPARILHAVSSFRRAIRLDHTDKELANLMDKTLADNSEAWLSFTTGATWYIDDESLSVFENGSLYVDYMLRVSSDGIHWCALRKVEGGVEYVGDIIVAPVDYFGEKRLAADDAVTGSLAVVCRRLIGRQQMKRSGDPVELYSAELEDWIIVSTVMKEWYKLRSAYIFEIYQSGTRMDGVTLAPSASQGRGENAPMAANVDAL